MTVLVVDVLYACESFYGREPTDEEIAETLAELGFDPRGVRAIENGG